MFLVATVKSVNVARGYGFLLTRKRDVYFHVSLRRLIEMREGKPIFTSEDSKVLPKIGDQLVLEVGSGEKGLFARRWNFCHALTTAVKADALISSHASN